MKMRLYGFFFCIDISLAEAFSVGNPGLFLSRAYPVGGALLHAGLSGIA